MLQLYLIRHAMAKSADPDQPDEAREVSKKGEKQLRATSMLFANKKINQLNPTVIISSPITRSMQTAAIIADETGYDPAKIVKDDQLAPGGDASKAFANMKKLVKDPDNDQIVMVGSNPTMTALGQIVHGMGTKAGESGAIRFKKSAMVRFDVTGFAGKNPSAELMNVVSPGVALAAKKVFGK